MNNWWKIRRFGSLLILGLVFGLAPQSLQAGGVVYVVPGGAGSQTGNDWANAKDLQMALQTSPPGTEFWVKQGTYLPTIHELRSPAFTPPNGSRLFGGFTGDETSRHARNPSQHPTILSGDLLGNDMGAASQSNPTRSDNSYQVIYCLSQTNPIVLDGFVISGGQAVEV